MLGHEYLMLSKGLFVRDTVPTVLLLGSALEFVMPCFKRYIQAKDNNHVHSEESNMRGSFHFL